VPSLLIMLDDGISEIWRVRALEVLSLLPESALLPHAARIAQHIEDRPDRAKLDRPTLCEQDEDPQLNPSNGICFDHFARPTLCEQCEDPQLNPWNGICFDHSAYPMWVDERVAALRVTKQLPEQVGLRTASIVSRCLGTTTGNCVLQQQKRLLHCQRRMEPIEYCRRHLAPA